MKNSLLPWKIVRSEYPMKTPWFSVRRDEAELPDGSVIDDYYVIERPEVVGIFAITEDEQVVMNLQYKHGIAEVVQEIPAGMVDEGEMPIEAAYRELEEETGYIAPTLIPIQTLIASPTSQNNRFHIFLAPGVKAEGQPVSTPQEDIVNVLIPLDEIRAKIVNGEITVLWSVAAIFLGLESYERYSK